MVFAVMYECMSPIVAIDVLKDYACESSKRCGAVGGATVSGPVHIRNVRTYVTCMYVHLYSAGGTKTTYISSLHLRTYASMYIYTVCMYVCRLPMALLLRRSACRVAWPTPFPYQCSTGALPRS